MRKLIILFAAHLLSSSLVFSQQISFPGAEGYGKYSEGGRGGIVLEVTNLNDSGAGSLRDAISGYTGQKRTIVFRVSGTIELQSTINVKNDAYLTIAGQTAPGDGICIKDNPITFDGCHDIIIRYMRFRPGDEQNCVSPDCDYVDGISIRNTQNIILDHCSLSWSIDAIMDLTVNTGNSTVQYCILSEALLNSKHSKGAHSMGTGWDGAGGATYHHNIIASCNSRTPRLDKYLNSDNSRDLIQIANNVIYNWSSYGAYGGENADVNYVNNYYKYGPSTGKKDQIFQADGECKMYVEGNYVYAYPDVTADNSKGIYVGGDKATSAELDTILVAAPFTIEEINLEPGEQCLSSVLATAGVSYPVRDAVDSRIIEDIIQQTGAIIDSPSQVGGWPVLNSQVAPVDSDHDGMPDSWEDGADLDSSDPSDRNLDRDGDGYTNLEEYLNSLVEIPDFVYSPIKLSASVIQDKTVRIDWTDVSDNENAFIVERKDGTEFVQVGTAGADAVNFDDIVPDYGTYYYRVKAVNDELSSLYTESIRIRVDYTFSGTGPALHSGMRIYPNPSNENVYIETYFPGDIKGLDIFDLLGRKIISLDGEMKEDGNFIYSWDGSRSDGSKAQPGVYLVRITSGSQYDRQLLVRKD